jgi:hypothetical protein
LGLVALLNRSHNTVPTSGDWFTEWWSVAYSGNIVEDAPAPMPNEEAYDRLNEAFASSGDNGGDVAERRNHPRFYYFTFFMFYFKFHKTVFTNLIELQCSC